MAQIFEVFGYPIEDQSQEARLNRVAALCPFMDRPCDGGGNRHLSKISLDKGKDLATFFPDRTEVHAGVCSIQVQPGTAPWIVCPRRLLVLGRDKADDRVRQKETQADVLRLLEYAKGTRLGVWPEVKFKYVELVGGLRMHFDYTFDYIIVPLGEADLGSLAETLGMGREQGKQALTRAGYTLARRNRREVVEDWPVGNPSIVEIMTSSTSGGNKRSRSGISSAFEDAILGKSHKSPGINYRQVWARMVSQLIVKSEIALEWGGKTIWVVQDLLVDYIRATTGLNLGKFLSKTPGEVNMLSFSYGSAFEKPSGVLELSKPVLYSGPMTSAKAGQETGPSFSDMIRAPIRPATAKLLTRLSKRRPSNEVFAP